MLITYLLNDRLTIAEYFRDDEGQDGELLVVVVVVAVFF